MAHGLRSGLRDGGLSRGGLHAGLGNGSIFNIASLDLNFAKYKNIGSLVTFTRASSGTFVGSNGLLQSAVTNLLLRSEEFDNAGWTKTQSSVSLNTATSPAGTLTADSLVENTASGAQHFISQTVTISANTIHTATVYVKANTRSSVRFGFLNNALSSGAFAHFNVSTGAISTQTTAGTALNVSFGIEAAVSGWYRCRATCTVDSSSTLGTVFIGLVDGTNNAVYTGDGTSGIFLWGAQLEQSTTVGEYIPTTSAINSAPRFDHNPTTGESLGLLVEEQRTNSIRNNTGVGAVAGTPGTLPTNWGGSTTVSGLSRQIVTVGTVDGINYVRLRVSGTTSAPFVFFAVSTFDVVAASTSQTWTASSYYQLQAGSLTGIILQHEIARFGPGYIGSTTLPFTPGSSALIRQRYALTTTVSDATATGINYGLQLVVPTSGTVVDFTVDIGLPQLEQGAFATSPIPTTTAAATRSADVASITGSAFTGWYRQDEGTVFADARTQQSAAGHILVGVSTGSFASSAYLSKEGDNVLKAAPDASPSNLNIALLSVSSNVGLRAALAFTAGTGSASAVMNGGTVNTDASTGIPITMSQMGIGTAPWNIGTTLWNGPIKRICFWPTRLASATLQTITQ